MGALIDLTGQRFNKLIAVRRAPQVGRVTRWECICDCGVSCVVGADNLRRNHTKSCGCMKVARAQAATAAKFTDSPEYSAWLTMKNRCHRPTVKAYASYGARGIYVCDRWRLSFRAFMEDMGPRPDGHSIDRRNNDGPYEPGNCYWATRREQARNTRATVWILFRGERRRLIDLCEEYGMSKNRARRRLYQLGLTPEQVFTKAADDMAEWADTVPMGEEVAS